MLHWIDSKDISTKTLIIVNNNISTMSQCSRDNRVILNTYDHVPKTMKS